MIHYANHFHVLISRTLLSRWGLISGEKNKKGGADCSHLQAAGQSVICRQAYCSLLHKSSLKWMCYAQQVRSSVSASLFSCKEYMKTVCKTNTDECVVGDVVNHHHGRCSNQLSGVICAEFHHLPLLDIMLLTLRCGLFPGSCWWWQWFSPFRRCAAEQWNRPFVCVRRKENVCADCPPPTYPSLIYLYDWTGWLNALMMLISNFAGTTQYMQMPFSLQE